MCGCESLPAYSASLNPPEGLPLGLQEGLTWIGRGTFKASTPAQLLCSRRQACFTLTKTGLRVECHGINPLLFVVCHSKNVHGTEATPATELFQLRKGEALYLADGDQFYFAAMECLLTVVIRQNDTTEISRDALPLPLQRASEACVKESEKSLIENEENAEFLRTPQDPAEDCGSSDPQLKNIRTLYTNSPKTGSAFHGPDVAGPSEFLAVSNPSVNPMVASPVLGKFQYEGVGNEQEDSDCLDLDAYDCLPPVGVSHLNVEEPPRCVSPQRRVEVSDPAVAVDDHNHHLNEEPYQIFGKNLMEEALPNSPVNEAPEDGRCAQFPIDGEGPPCIREDRQAIDSNLCSRDRAHELEGDEDLPIETCAFSRQREPEDYNLIMSSETVDDRSIGDELLLSEPATRLAVDNVGECPDELPNMDTGIGASGILPRSPVSRVMDAIPVSVEVDEHPEVSGRAYESEHDPDVFIAVEEDSWPDGPVRGMESVIVSVSGYEGLDRQNLVKLINKTGAAFTGQLSKANTHLVSWKLYGKKFDRAMKLGKVVINHQWFEDSLRAGERLPESPYKLRSGEEVGLVKWKENLPPLVTERDEPSDGAVNQHRINQEAPFSKTSDQEGQRGQRAVCAVSDRKGLPSSSRQVALPNVECGRTGGRKKSSRLVKLSVAQGNMARENPAAPPTGAGELYQRRTEEHVGPWEEGFHYTSRRRSNSSALRGADQVHEHNAKRRKSASSVIERCNDDQGRGAVDNVRGRGRSQFSAGPNRELTFVNMSDDVEGMREIGLQMPKLGSAPATEGTSADMSRGKNPECSQSSEPEREVACAICLVEAKSPSEGLLECGHKFCFMCIFTWTTQKAAKGPRCPLCKASCNFITKQVVDSSGKLDETLVDLGKKEMGCSSGIQRTIVVDAVCIHCGNSDAEPLLMRCGSCGNRAIHTFCMDPPTEPPWFCPACTESNQRDSMRLAWNQFLPGGSTDIPTDAEIRPISPNVRRRNVQSYRVRRPPRPSSVYNPMLHAELAQTMGPTRRTNIVGQHSLRNWLNNETSSEDA